MAHDYSYGLVITTLDDQVGVGTGTWTLCETALDGLRKPLQPKAGQASPVVRQLRSPKDHINIRILIWYIANVVYGIGYMVIGIYSMYHINTRILHSGSN